MTSAPGRVKLAERTFKENYEKIREKMIQLSRKFRLIKVFVKVYTVLMFLLALVAGFDLIDVESQYVVSGVAALAAIKEIFLSQSKIEYIGNTAFELESFIRKITDEFNTELQKVMEAIEAKDDEQANNHRVQMYNKYSSLMREKLDEVSRSEYSLIIRNIKSITKKDIEHRA